MAGIQARLDEQAFDLRGPLPSGVTVLEASAGTGKTYTIAALAARFIAEGAATLDQLLLVTFTRVATSELRERVRERLVVTEAQLARVAAGALPTYIDEIVELLAGGPVELVRERQQRLAHAIANFDAATIETTHGFCQKVLDELGTLAESDPSVSFVDSRDRASQVTSGTSLATERASRTSSISWLSTPSKQLTAMMYGSPASSK